MPNTATHVIPDIGDEITIVRAGVTRRGRVHYADQLQVLVKWDDGGSSSLRVGQTPFQIIPRQSRKSTHRAVTGSRRIPSPGDGARPHVPSPSPGPRSFR